MLQIRFLALLFVLAVLTSRIRGDNIPYQPMQLRSLKNLYAAAQTRIPTEEGFDDETSSQVGEQQLNQADAMFNALVFGQESDQVESRLNSLLRLKIKEVGAVCELTSTQEAKLGLAGRGDIKRLFDRLEKLRDSFRHSGTTGIVTEGMAKETGLLQTIVIDGRLFNDGSLFAKTMRMMLTAEQVERVTSAKGFEDLKWLDGNWNSPLDRRSFFPTYRIVNRNLGLDD